MRQDLDPDSRLNLVRSIHETLLTLEQDLSDLGAHSEANHLREIQEHVSKWTVRSVLSGHPRSQKDYEGPELIEDIL